MHEVRFQCFSLTNFVSVLIKIVFERSSFPKYYHYQLLLKNCILPSVFPILFQNAMKIMWVYPSSAHCSLASRNLRLKLNCNSHVRHIML